MEYNEILSFMSSTDFNQSSLKNSLKLGLFSSEHNEPSVLLKACAEHVLKNVSDIANKIDLHSQVVKVK